VNERTENIGARRLSTVMERLLDEVSFDATRLEGQTVRIDAAYVDQRLAELSHERGSFALHPLRPLPLQRRHCFTHALSRKCFILERNFRRRFQASRIVLSR
jgi:transposase